MNNFKGILLTGSEIDFKKILLAFMILIINSLFSSIKYNILIKILFIGLLFAFIFIHYAIRPNIVFTFICSKTYSHLPLLVLKTVLQDINICNLFPYFLLL